MAVKTIGRVIVTTGKTHARIAAKMKALAKTSVIASRMVVKIETHLRAVEGSKMSKLGI